ncbi:MAG: aspartate aminotransferase [Candidatus Marinimicrobia bacterium]|nr:aspartate aminotransferase [Candidatus Neomarinimicrobiota bacterium]|tara:strand:+ start:15284 stop:16450 length:1167 start_codon:yes stop_codon:yes gene_type:complete
MKIAERISRIQPSITLEMTAKAAELRKKGLDVINLSVGEPDFETPENIKKAAFNAIKKGATKYTAGSGTPELKTAVINKLKRDNRLNYGHENIIVSCGGKHSLYNACQVLFEKNDEVIIFSPYWVSFPDFVSVTGASPVIVPTIAENNYEPDFSILEKKINSNTKGIIINSPSNPTGGIWGDEAILRVLELAKKNNIWVFSDECYEQLTYDKPFTSVQNYDLDNDRILTFQSLSKTYCMTGWRIGYTAGNKHVIKAMSKLQSQSTSCPNSIAQEASIEALTGSQADIKKMKKEFRKRRDFIVKELNLISGVECQKPGGAFYVFPSFKELINNNKINSAWDLCFDLLEKEHIASVPGKSFGSDESIRFSYAISLERIKLAIQKIKEVLK